MPVNKILIRNNLMRQTLFCYDCSL